MKRQTLDGMWQLFREQQRLNNAPEANQLALEYAFKCGIAAAIVLYIDIGQVTATEANIIVHSIMNDFGAYIRSRADLMTANKILN